MKHQARRECGFSYLAIIIATAVLTSVVLIGVRMWRTHNPSVVSKELKNALANADCANEKDMGLCKFFVSVNTQKFTTIDFTSFTNGTNTSGSYQTDNDAKYHVSTESSGKIYEIIGIGTTLYSKDTDGKTWWKQQVRQSDLDNYNSAPGTGQVFAATTADGKPVTYYKQDTSPCPTISRLTCTKYQISDPTYAGQARFIWFDTKYYQLQRLKTIDNNATVDATFGYKQASIKAPGGSKKLPTNKYVVPGQSTPVTVPDGGVGPDIQGLFGN